MPKGFSHFKKEPPRLIEVENDIWIDLFDTVKTEIAQKKPNSDLLTSKPMACRTCASCAKLKMRTVHANSDPIHDLARELVQKLAFARLAHVPQASLACLLASLSATYSVAK